MFEQFQSFIPKTIGRLNLHKQTTAAHVIYLAKKFIHQHNPHLLKEIKISSFQKQTLKIICPHPILAQEILTIQKDLINHINQQLKFITIKKIQTTSQENPGEYHFR